MPPRKRRARFPTPPPVDEEFSVHEISSDEPEVVAAPPPAAAARAKPKASAKASSSKSAGSNGKQKQQPKEVVQLDDDDDEDVEMEEVDVSGAAAGAGGDDEDEDLEMDEVEVSRAGEEGYAAAYAAAEAAANNDNVAGPSTLGAPVFKDGKGQPPGVLSLNLGTAAESAAAKKKRTQNVNRITPRDRQVRSATHKLHALALIAHAKVRNEWLNDEALRDALFESVPAKMRTDLMKIHPKRMENPRERVRQFETFMRDLTDWWARRRFHLDPNCTVGSALRQPNADALAGAFPPPGIRVDGWLVETAAEREERWKTEREQQKTQAKGKGKATDSSDENPLSKRKFSLAGKAPTTDITLFGPGASATTPTYLRLLPPYEHVTSPEDLLDLHEARGGSRETSAQLFCALCRALGIPARLVISLQVPSWSIAAAKVAATQGAVEKAKKPGANLPKRRKIEENLPAARRADDDFTSDEEQNGAAAASGTTSPLVAAKGTVASRAGTTSVATPTRVKALAAQGTPSRPVSVSASEAGSARGSVRGSDAETSAAGPSRSTGKRKRDDVAETGGGFEVDSSDLSSAGEEEAAPAKGKGKKGKGKAAPKGKGRKKKEPEKPKEPWIPRNTEFKPRLRPSRPKKLKEGEVGAQEEELEDVDPVDITAPPTMWVEVYSKPWKRWITVDPVRGRTEVGENRRMEPGVNDRSNRLVYVVAFEEDGYARDVTARYTKTLHSRVSKMRPPGLKGDKDGWWGKVVAAFHRKAKLERDAVEDLELGEAADREPMPSSVGAFKDHPVYAIEKHLKRDEVIHPPDEVGTFQGVKVYPRANVLTCRSQKQWYNEGRVVSKGEIALKWVKSRGYTLANKRAEEQAKADGGEAPQEGLYARHQTEIYQAPPVVDGKVPTNNFGNIDLFVPSMLPAGAAHIPYNGAGKVAKKLGISYAEAITGFEFRKFRSHPRFTGIVVAQENEDMVAEAYWESEQAAAQKEYSKRQERAMKNWKRVVNALRIAKRVQQQYGKDAKAESSSGAAKNKAASSSGAEVSKLRRLEEDGGAESGGFLVDGEDEPAAEKAAPSRRTNGLARFAAGAPSRNGEASGSAAEAHSSDEDEQAAQAGMQQDEDDALDVEDIFGAGAASTGEGSSKRSGKIISLASLASDTSKRANGRKAAASKPPPKPATTERAKPRPRIVVRRGRRAASDEEEAAETEEEEELPRARRASSSKRAAKTKETPRRSGRASVKSADAIVREAQERAFAEALQDEEMDEDDEDDDE